MNMSAYGLFTAMWTRMSCVVRVHTFYCQYYWEVHCDDDKILEAEFAVLLNPLETHFRNDSILRRKP